MQMGEQREIINNDVIAAGLCMDAKMRHIENYFDAKTLEEASKKWVAGLSLVSLLQYAAKINTGRSYGPRSVRSLLRAAFPSNLYSTCVHCRDGLIDVSPAICMAMNKLIVQYFDAVDQTWRAIANVRPVRDFRSTTGYSLAGDADALDDNAARSFGYLFGINRHDLFCDDPVAFTEIAARTGRGGALKLNKVFWSIFLNNDTFFINARGNAMADDGKTISGESLAKAEAMFESLVDPDGKPIGVHPSIVLVPPGMKQVALRCVEDRNRNLPPRLALSVHSSPYLSNNTYTGHSTRNWYLLAAPETLPTMEVCFLNGIERPVVDEAFPDFEHTELKILASFDFGVALQEYRGGVRVTQAGE
jgi:hypothetical protein